LKSIFNRSKFFIHQTVQYDGAFHPEGIGIIPTDSVVMPACPPTAFNGGKRAMDSTPSELMAIGGGRTQRSRSVVAATLGWMMQSRWDRFGHPVRSGG